MRPIDYFDRAVQHYPNDLFVADEEIAFTFEQASRSSHEIAKGLAAAGFELGQGVAVFSPNNALAVVCIFGCYRVGGAWTPINVRNAVPNNVDFLVRANVKWFFFHSSLEQEARAIAASVPGLLGVICMDVEYDFCLSLADFCDAGIEIHLKDWSDPFGSPGETFALWPTGGTTGPSKAIEMNVGAVTTMIELGLACYLGDSAEDVAYLAVAPITHAAGILIPVFSAVGGATYTLSGFAADRVLRAIEAHRITHMFLPPTAFYSLLEAAVDTDLDLTSLRQIILAAAPVAPAKLREGVRVFGPVIAQCYGQGEAPMLISWMSPEAMAEAVEREDRAHRLASCGRATSMTQIAILNDLGEQLTAGERGEICISGPLVTRGYLNAPEATAQARAFGWHHTGDIGYLDDDGFLYIVDRKKDMIISGGFNVYAAEVEAAILTLDEVLECAVIGLPDEKWGESVTAILIPKNQSAIDTTKVIETVKTELGAVCAPKLVLFWNELPKTAVGKIDKKVIRQQVASSLSG